MRGENSVNQSIMSYGYTYFMVLKSTMCCWILTSNPLEWQRTELQLLFGRQVYSK